MGQELQMRSPCAEEAGSQKNQKENIVVLFLTSQLSDQKGNLFS